MRFQSSLAMRLLLLSALIACGRAAAAPAEDPLVQRGRYISLIAGCNACHTEGFAVRLGEAPERDWMTGSAVGNSGPWGTTYPANLRLYMQTISADQWVRVAKTSTMRPPMPWFDLRAMEEGDLRALHAFIRYLGPAGKRAPPSRQAALA